MKEAIKVAVTGAAGQIGYALVFRLCSGEVFGDRPVRLSLLELETALPALRGVVMELEDCAFPRLQGVSVSSDPAEAFRDADWALLVGSVPRKQGMERADLLKVNGRIFVEQGRALDNAKPTCRVLVVGNPCNTNCLIASRHCTTLSPRRFFALMMLDRNRAVALLARRAGVDVSSVENLVVWGNHSLTQYPDFVNARLGGRPVREVLPEDWLKTGFLERVRRRGAEVIGARGASSAASAANAVLDTIRGLDRGDGVLVNAAVPSDGSYGVPEGLVFGFPLRPGDGDYTIDQGFRHDDYGRAMLEASVEELAAEREACGVLQ